jgi:hypothetical protein
MHWKRIYGEKKSRIKRYGAEMIPAYRYFTPKYWCIPGADYYKNKYLSWDIDSGHNSHTRGMLENYLEIVDYTKKLHEDLTLELHHDFLEP